MPLNHPLHLSPHAFCGRSVQSGFAAVFLLLLLPCALPGSEVLTIDSTWRFQFAHADHVAFRNADGSLQPSENARHDRGAAVAGPQGSWYATDYDDSGWEWRSGPVFPGRSGQPTGHGQGEHNRLSHYYLRGRFVVEDPAAVRSLLLSLRYRGGVVVYLNGEEITRAHLPDGELDASTLATDYPSEVSNPNPDNPEQSAEVAKLRLREINELALPVAQLRRGVNIIAIGGIRCAHPEEANAKHTHRKRWATVGLQELSLRSDPNNAVHGHDGAPRQLHLWTAPIIADVGGSLLVGDPALSTQGIPPMTLIGARNTTVSGQAILSGKEAVTGVEASIGVFVGESGTLPLPEDAVQIRYPARRSPHMNYGMERPDVLLDEVLGEEKVQPIWVTVHIPADAPSGTYRAELTIAAAGLDGPQTVPVELEIHAWDAPDPQAWRMMNSYLQSPHSVAWHYGVEMWSSQHLELLQPSLEMLRALGNQALYIDVITPNFFGPEHGIIVFTDQEGQLRPDFSYLERYLDAYAQHVGEPRRINLVLWEPSVERDEKLRVSVRTANGGLEHRELPLYGDAASRETWQLMMQGVRERVLARGWDERSIMIGVGHDARPRESIVAFFKDIAPFARWMLFTHGRGDPPIRDGQLTIGEMSVGLQEYPYYARGRAGNLRQGLQRGWVNDWYAAVTIYAGRLKLNDNSTLADFRLFPNAGVIGGSYGLCRQGIDKWPVVNPAQPDQEASRRVHGSRGWGNLYRQKVRAIAAPGPQGAVATARFEQLREGLQDTAVRIYLERAISDEARAAIIGNAIAEEIRAINEMEWLHRDAHDGLSSGPDWQQRVRRRYALAAQIQSLLAEAGLPLEN